jgi:hypothetical protein
VARATLELDGWLAGQADSPQVFKLPALTLVGAKSEETALHIAADTGLVLREEARQNLLPLLDAHLPPSERSYVCKGGVYGGAFTLQPLPATAGAAKSSAAQTKERTQPAPASPRVSQVRTIQLIQEEQFATILDGERWLHQATYWLYRDVGSELLLHLPAGGLLLRLTLDGQEIAVAAHEQQPLWLPLTGVGGLHTLHLAWLFEDGSEALAEPNLNRPLLEGVIATATGNAAGPLWTLQVPSGYQLRAKPGTTTATTVDRDLSRAEALLRLSGLLAEQGSAVTSAPTLAGVQEQFYRYTQVARTRLAHPNLLHVSSRDAQVLARRREDLEEKNRQLAQIRHFEKLRSQAEKQASTPPAVSADPVTLLRLFEGEDLWVGQGLRSYWPATAQGNVPQLRLVALGQRQQQQAVGLTGFLVVLALLAWVVAYSPRLVAWLRVLWPEALVVGACLASLILGQNILLTIPIVLGVGGRLYYGLLWILARQRRTSPSDSGGKVA